MGGGYFPLVEISQTKSTHGQGLIIYLEAQRRSALGRWRRSLLLIKMISLKANQKRANQQTKVHIERQSTNVQFSDNDGYGDSIDAAN